MYIYIYSMYETLLPGLVSYKDIHYILLDSNKKETFTKSTKYTKVTN